MKNEETLLHILDGTGLILLANLFYTQKLRGIIRNLSLAFIMVIIIDDSTS